MSDYFTATTCSDSSYDDLDHDGLGDQCEWALAKRFAPIFATDAYDDVGGDPYWAVRPQDSTTIVIAYFPAYYGDQGCYAALSCGTVDNGHIGDSEAIGIAIKWHPATRHWVVVSAALSHHFSYTTFTGTSYATGLEYPTELGGPFAVHVSWGKHANYATRSACNAGGYFSEDYCGNASTPSDTMYVSSDRNLGSDGYRLKDCVKSSILYDDYEECFWSGEYFLGWQSPPGDTAPYSVRLDYFGFTPF